MVDIHRDDIITGALAGVLGTLAFTAFFLAIGNTGTVAMAIPALYGITGPSLLIGGLIHTIHGAVLGVIFTSLISAAGQASQLENLKTSLIWGLGYGLVTTLLLAAILMPIWLSTVGFPNAPSVPNFNPMGLLGHFIYGGVLGASYPLISDRLTR